MPNSDTQGKKPLILDTTLRDGSYAINFKFSYADTRTLCGELDRCGFDLIEIGHGIGLGASEAGHGAAAETDETYMKAAADVIKRGKWGMFCIPGIAHERHLDLAADHGMHFVRVGTEVSRVADAVPFIKRAKAHGMMVCANFMKSYAMSPDAFAECAKVAEDAGADAIYVVDSAGGMLVEELEAYIIALRKRVKMGIGFHGHNNLGLAVATAVRAAELGADIIDTSLQGMGRSSGNTPTEQFLAVLSRKGWNHGYDILDIQDIGEKYIKPLMAKGGWDSLEVVSGMALFHSAYMNTIQRFAGIYGVDPRRLIMAVCAESRVDASAELVERKAKELASTATDVTSARFHFERYHGQEQS